mmetsp:Transcript_13405/g.38612  ORF Transcript_13405/g.38612 Transcript_13405/m.38612 type:complete len:402 (+) Transcript_13405:1213-2418(+)
MVLLPSGGAGVLDVPLGIRGLLPDVLQLRTGGIDLHMQGFGSLRRPALVELATAQVAAALVRHLARGLGRGTPLLEGVLEALQLPPPLLCGGGLGRLDTGRSLRRHAALHAARLATELLGLAGLCAHLGVEFLDLAGPLAQLPLRLRQGLAVGLGLALGGFPGGLGAGELHVQGLKRVGVGGGGLRELRLQRQHGRVALLQAAEGAVHLRRAAGRRAQPLDLRALLDDLRPQGDELAELGVLGGDGVSSACGHLRAEAAALCSSGLELRGDGGLLGLRPGDGRLRLRLRASVRRPLFLELGLEAAFAFRALVLRRLHLRAEPLDLRLHRLEARRGPVILELQAPQLPCGAVRLLPRDRRLGAPLPERCLRPVQLMAPLLRRCGLVRLRGGRRLGTSPRLAL